MIVFGWIAHQENQNETAVTTEIDVISGIPKRKWKEKQKISLLIRLIMTNPMEECQSILNYIMNQPDSGKYL